MSPETELPILRVARDIYTDLTEWRREDGRLTAQEASDRKAFDNRVVQRLIELESLVFERSG